MVRRRSKVVFFLLLLSLSPPFLSERSPLPPSHAPPSDQQVNLPLSDQPYTERVEQVSKLLLTPTFPLHLLWIIGLSLLFLAAVIDVLLKVVFTICSLGVTSVSPKQLPTVSSLKCFGPRSSRVPMSPPDEGWVALGQTITTISLTIGSISSLAYFDMALREVVHQPGYATASLVSGVVTVLQLVCLIGNKLSDDEVQSTLRYQILNTALPLGKNNRTAQGDCIKTLYIKDQHDKVWKCLCKGNLANLKSAFYSKSGIPERFQKFYYKNHLLTEDHDVVNLPDESMLTFSIGLLGGTPKCEICYDNATHICKECDQKIFCINCCTTFHRHPLRSSHTATALSPKSDGIAVDDSNGISRIDPDASCSAVGMSCHADSYDIWDDESVSSSPNTSAVFQDAAMVMTLAEKFNMTRFKPFQKQVIDSILSQQDCLVIQPTGSGKSMCFQFPAVYKNKMAIVVVPTISLMQDHVTNCKRLGIKAELLGSAQPDLLAEDRVLSLDSDVSIVLVTPEWMANPHKKDKVKELVSNGKVCMIAIDEAHLFHYWKEFRPAYKDLESLRTDFPNTPLMCLTATAPHCVEQSIHKLLRDPLLSRSSINRPNIFLACEEIPSYVGRKDFSYFASRVSDIISEDECTIIYTDFIDDVGPIMSELSEKNIDSVAYYGEMDMKTRSESFDRWRCGDVKVMVATSAFGMGINQPNIRNIIRYGVPESICSWAQELGRAGRDNSPAKATIFYSQTHIEHANAWVKGHLHNREHCCRILKEFSSSWRYVMSNLAHKCRRETLLELFGEESTERKFESVCCDVCEGDREIDNCDHSEELKILYDAMHTIGPKGELKLSQWIRGSTVMWTDAHDKYSMSYGNAKGHSEKWWREFIRRCHVLGLVQKELQSIIKKNKHYGIQGIVCETENGRQCVQQNHQLLMVRCSDECSVKISATRHAGESKQSVNKGIRSGKGCHGIALIKMLIEDEENWERLSCKDDYQFPGVFPHSKFQRAYYTDDCKSLPQSTSDPHFLWQDIQISKSGWNKDRQVTVKIAGKSETLMYRVASCNGVKVCPEKFCDYVAPFSAQRPCSAHPQHKLIKTKDTQPCPVQFAYLYPQNATADNRRWIFAFVRRQSGPSQTLHNHKIHGSTKVCSKVKEMISDAVELNPTLKPSEIIKGKGVKAVPGAIDKGSTHLGKIANVVKKCRLQAMACEKWDIENFEQVADEIDKKDEELTGNSIDSLKLKAFMRPYMVSTGIEDGIKFILCMSPFMCSLLAESEFIEADITYNESREFRYLFNAVAFNYTTMDWVVICRIRMDKQTAAAYSLAYSKMFAKCKKAFHAFEPGKTLLGIVVDWSDAEIRGLALALGEEQALTLLKGCKVHWARSWQRVRDRIIASSNREREKALFSLIASEIPKIPAGKDLENAFSVLCKEKKPHCLVGVINGFAASDATFIDLETNWSKAKKWVEWWMRPTHLKLLHKDYSMMNDDIWKQCPSDTNAVERKNLDSKGSLPQAIQAALINMYKYDKAACAKHVAAKEGISVSYAETSLDARKKQAIKRSICRRNDASYDKVAQYGPPDRQCHFQEPAHYTRLAVAEGPRSKHKYPKLSASEDCTEMDITTRTSPESLSHISIDDESTDMDVEVYSSASHTYTTESTSVSSESDSSSGSYNNKYYVGRRLQMRFHIESSDSHEWFDGKITSFDSASGLYGVYFECDGETVYINPSQEADDIIFYK